MNLFSFTAEFTDEQSCQDHFKEQREKEGITCEKCGGKHHYWLKKSQCTNVQTVLFEHPYAVGL